MVDCQFTSSRQYIRRRWLTRETSHTASALMAALHTKHPATAEHAWRVALYAGAIGRHLNLSATDLVVLHTAALLHDMGKIGISNALLDKPGRLEANERLEIQQHPLLSESIVSSLALGRLVAPLVRSHHERWDGDGYPDGIGGVSIPLGARIIAVADAYDVMTSHRPYARCRSPFEALCELRNGAGSQWDPAIVTAFEGMGVAAAF